MLPARQLRRRWVKQDATRPVAAPDAQAGQQDAQASQQDAQASQQAIDDLKKAHDEEISIIIHKYQQLNGALLELQDEHDKAISEYKLIIDQQQEQLRNGADSVDVKDAMEKINVISAKIVDLEKSAVPVKPVKPIDIFDRLSKGQSSVPIKSKKK